MTEPTALVTGASRGIGAALATELANRGFNLILNARGGEDLEALCSSLSARVTVTPWVADLTHPSALVDLVDLVDYHPIEVLVNNAGGGEPGSFVNQAPAAHQQVINLNVAALTEITHACLPAMIRRGRGRILNVASVAAFTPVANLAVYAASKAYVLSFTESLNEELRGTGVTLTALCPGLTRTGMTDHLTSRLNLPEALVAEPDAVAITGIDALLAREVISVPGVLNQAAVAALKHQPRALTRGLSGLIARMGALGR